MALRERNRDRVRARLFASALKMLAARARSEQQLRARLLGKTGADAALVEECIARLKELGYLDDRAFAENFATYRLLTKPVGRSRLARELVQKEVARELVNETVATVFEQTSEEELIERALHKHVRAHGSPREPKSRNKLIAYLARRGFPYDLILRKVRALEGDDGEWETAGPDPDGDV